MNTTTVGVICSIVFGVLGFIVAYLTFIKKKDKDNVEEGENRGVIASDIGYIKSGVDDLKRETREMRGDVSTLSERVTRVEESTKQAHKRIDEFKDSSKQWQG